MAKHTSKIIIDKHYYFSPPSAKDKSFFVKYLNDRDIYDRTLNIPSPYKASDAEKFIRFCGRKKKEAGRPVNWLIRQANGEAIGGMGFFLKYGINSHKDEIGYWLAKPFWGKGIMTKALQCFCRHGFISRGLVRIEAGIFETNLASQRVAEKCGFVYEGTMKKMYFKDGKYFNGKLYALVKE